MLSSGVNFPFVDASQDGFVAIAGAGRSFTGTQSRPHPGGSVLLMSCRF